MRLATSKPYAKLADCIGQKLVAAVVHERRLDAVLVFVFENAWARVEVYGYDSDDGPTQVLRERRGSVGTATDLADSEWGAATLRELATLGLLSAEDVESVICGAQATEREKQERLEREDYMRLKAKFESEVKP
jgi:hypothetical protein